MKELQKKYAKVLLTTCLKIEKTQPLFINANVEIIDFVRIIADTAYSLGVKDIYFDLSDPYLKHDALKNLDIKDLKKLSFWDKKVWNEYAEKNAAFLCLASQYPGLMADIDPEKIKTMTMYSLTTNKTYENLRAKSKLSWCIAAVPTQLWATKIFPKAKNPLEKFWNIIFDICGIKEKNPNKFWDNKIKKMKKIADKLNSYNFKYLKYKDPNGTDLTIELPQNHLWVTGNEAIGKKDIIVNFPTEEIFTSPKLDSANGTVYSSKPLNYQDNIIQDFKITFKDGVAISCKAKKGEKLLKQIIKSCQNSDRLGEISLVPYDSAISKTNLLFYETLFDENAACHMALGTSFAECVKDGVSKSKEELEKIGLNQCSNHVDFMIGTKKMNIVGITQDNKEIVIFEKGNFSKKFK